jgi:adenylate kinase family enzyme
LLRAERETPNSQHGPLIDSYLSEGKIVPVSISLSLLKREIMHAARHADQRRFLIDGFPRNDDNLQGWMSSMRDVCDIEMVVYLDCHEEELQRRILERGKTSNRSDDNLTTIKKRFLTFQQDTLPVINYFQHSYAPVPYIRRSLSYRFVHLDGSQSIDEVFSDLKSTIADTMVKDMTAANSALTEAIAEQHHLDRQALLQEHASTEGFGQLLFIFETEVCICMSVCVECCWSFSS